MPLNMSSLKSSTLNHRRPGPD